MKTLMILSALALVQVVCAHAADSIYSISLKDIDGKSTSLKAYKGKVLLIVNVASKCGYTPQYAGLEALHEKYKDKGFSVLGFPLQSVRRSGTRDQ
jgi:glutathione peroxidase